MRIKQYPRKRKRKYALMPYYYYLYFASTSPRKLKTLNEKLDIAAFSPLYPQYLAWCLEHMDTHNLFTE